MKDGVAAYAVLTRRADSARAARDERTRGQVMADELIAAVLGTRADGQAEEGKAGEGKAGEGKAGEGKAGEGKASVRPRVELGVVMTDAALYGGADDPAHLEDFGPIPAELAREIVVGACTADEEVWLRRLYASPTTGELVSMDGRGRYFRGGLARFYAKDARGWRSRPRPDGTIETTTPTGHTYLTRPPPVATIRQRHLPRLTIDYVLAG